MKRIKVILTIAILAASSSLFAHGMMSDSYPKNGAIMADPTEHVAINFTKPTKLMTLKVVDAKGNAIDTDFKRVKAAAVHFKAMLSNIAPGDYKVHWKAMGNDGHLGKGFFGFVQH